MGIKELYEKYNRELCEKYGVARHVLYGVTKEEAEKIDDENQRELLKRMKEPFIHFLYKKPKHIAFQC